MIKVLIRSFILGAMVGAMFAVVVWWNEIAGPPKPFGATYPATMPSTWDTCTYDIRDLTLSVPDFSGGPHCFDFTLSSSTAPTGGLFGGDQETSELRAYACVRCGGRIEDREYDRHEKLHAIFNVVEDATANLPVPAGEVPAFRELGGQLIVTHTPAAHRRVAAELEWIRLAPRRWQAFIAMMKYALVGGVVSAGLAGLVMGWKYRRHRRIGCCTKCGYDLRATPDRCPECGEIPAVSRSIPAHTPGGTISNDHTVPKVPTHHFSA